jgi:hypothetical protein
MCGFCLQAKRTCAKLTYDEIEAHMPNMDDI